MSLYTITIENCENKLRLADKELDDFLFLKEEVQNIIS